MHDRLRTSQHAITVGLFGPNEELMTDIVDAFSPPSEAHVIDGKRWPCFFDRHAHAHAHAYAYAHIHAHVQSPEKQCMLLLLT